MTCSLCKKIFQNTEDQFANVMDGFIYCHYGSKYDLLRFKINKKNILKNKDLICDHCIEDMLNNKDIEKDENFNLLDFLTL